MSGLTAQREDTGAGEYTSELAVHEYSGADLSPVRTTVVSKNVGQSVLGELGGELYVLSHAGPTIDHLYLYALPDSGSVQTQVLATGSAAATALGTFAVPPGGGLLTCGTFFKSGQYGPPAVLRIDPPDTMTKTLSLGTGAGDCRLFAGPDRDLVFWAKTGEVGTHWNIVSADGTKLLTDSHGPSLGVFTTAYGEGAFASVECYDGGRSVIIYLADPATAAVRGPYTVPTAAPWALYPGVAGEGQNLWVAYNPLGAGIHLAKLGPLPE